MKTLIISVVMIAMGSVLWWTLSNTARFSIKKWDGKFESVLRRSLSDVGLTDQHVVSSFHEVQKSDEGQWVTHHLAIQMVDPAKREALKENLEKSGASVEEIMDDKSPALLIRRGRRVYQKIKFVPPTVIPAKVSQ